MASRQAKVSIGLDYKPLRQDVREAKKMLSDIGNAKIDPALRNSIRKIIDKDVVALVEIYKRKITDTTAELHKMARASEGAVDSKGIKKAIRDLAQYQSALRQVSSQPSNGNDVPSRGRSMLGTLKGAAATLGVGLGVSAAVSRSEGRAQAGLGVRQLSGGASVGGRSELGFTDMDRKQRALEIVRETGRDMGQPEITRRVDKSERMERSFGVSGGEFAGAIGAARRSGIGDQEGFVAGTIGDAVAMKLSGSSIGEYLNAMTGYLGSISKGVDVKQDSLRGFASALGGLDFFKKDPSRIFESIGKLDRLFKGGGDEYQNFATYSAIEQAGGGADQVGPAGVQVRRSMGIFGGGGGLGDRARAAGMDDLGSAVDINGEDALNKFLTNAFKTATAGGNLGGKTDNTTAAALFQEITGMTDQSGVETFIGMSEAQKKGQSSLPKGARKAFEKSIQSPEDRMKAVMESFDGSVVKFSERVDTIKNQIADGITGGVLGLVGSVDKFSAATGLFESDIAKFGAAVAIFAGGKIGTDGMGSFAGGALGGAMANAGSKAMGFLGVGGAVVAAGAAGLLFGDAVRSKLDEWTEGSWSKAVDSFWTNMAETMGMDLGGEKSEERRREKSEREDKYGAADMATALKKAGRETSPEAIEEMVTIRERMQISDLSKARLEAGSKREKLPEGFEPELRPVDDVLKKYEERNPVGLAGGGMAAADISKRGWRGENKDAKWNTYSKYVDSRGNVWERSMWDGKYYNKGRREGSGEAIASRANGGPVGVNSTKGFSRGGSMGRDNIDAKLMGGEFVVNARDASSNMMALVHANSGGRVKPYADGGSVGGMDVGVPSSVGLDSGMMEAALSGNTRALMMLAQILSGKTGATSPSRSFQRGSSGVRYG